MNWILEFKQVAQKAREICRRHFIVSGFVCLDYYSKDYQQVLRGQRSAVYQGDVVNFHWPTLFEFFDYFTGWRLVSIEFDGAWTGTPKWEGGYLYDFGWLRYPRKLKKIFKLPIRIVEPASDVVAVFEK